MTQAKAANSVVDVLPKKTLVEQGYARGISIPWRAKMWIKVVLSLLPFSYRFLSTLGIFRHGNLADNTMGLKVYFDEQFKALSEMDKSTPEHILELGPGDSIGHALFAKAAGVKKMWLVDVGDYATHDEDHYRAVSDELGLSPKSYDRDSILSFSNSEYLSSGLNSLKTVPAGTLDFSFSQAVLEHVARSEFQDTMNELFRAHKSGSISRHWVDIHDHLGCALNSYRFSPKFWESKIVRGAGFYTNRLTMNEIVDMARNAGFNVSIEHVIEWPELPTPKNAMHDFAGDKTEEDLNVCTFLMIMEKPQ